MKNFKIIVFTLFIALSVNLTAFAQESTTVVVRAKAKDANFIGDGMGGAMISIIESSTGDTLARGLTKGGTGDTERLVKDPVERYEQLSTRGAAKFKTTLSLNKPTKVTISAMAPYGKPDARVKVSVQQWLIPGKDITGDGIILEVPGFVVTNQLPEKGAIFNVNEPIPIRTHIVMMCGCPTSDGGLWDSSEYEIKAQIRKEGNLLKEIPLSFTGQTSLFEATYTPSEPGNYTITVYAFHSKTANTGVDRTKVIVEE